MRIIKAGKRVTVTGLTYFDLEQTLTCGQYFRFYPLTGDEWLCLAAGLAVKARQPREDTLVLSGCTEKEFDGFWRGYFDIDRDYGALRETFNADPYLLEAMDSCPGIRVLRQDFWETLVSFIISANNNIPRIRGIIERLCERFGKPRSMGDITYHAFPSPRDLAGRAPEELADIRAGFRAAYILAAARMARDGDITEARIKEMSTDAARKELMRVPGVGPKVADCVLLYGAGRLDAFPADVWIRRALRENYGDENCDSSMFGPYAGLAQMYLFHHTRVKARSNKRGAV